MSELLINSNITELESASKPGFVVSGNKVSGDLILAPMDGYSIAPFRLITRRLGSALSYTEFINASDVIHNSPGLEQRIKYYEEERPIIYQIYDENPERILKAALILQEHSPDMIDINLGCPSKSVANRGAGAGLLRQPDKIIKIFQILSSNLRVPLTAKIRLGWDETSMNYLEVARIIEDCGGVLLAVHARTKSQSYGGKVNWDAIAHIKQSISIPVIGNGDICTVADIDAMKTYTGCDGIMIGRAAVTNPWIFMRRDRVDIPREDVNHLIYQQLQCMIDFYGETRGIILFRKYLKAYLKPYSLPREFLLEILTTETTSVLCGLLKELANE